MKQKLQRLAMLMAMLLAFIQANAHDFEVDGIYYNKTSDTTVAVTYQGSSSHSEAYSGMVVIPEKIAYSGKNYSVTSIGNKAFFICGDLTRVTIPNSVTSIGSYAFSECRRLVSIDIGNSVKTIGDHAFYYCRSITSVTIPNTVISIDSYAFYNCDKLTSIDIGNSVTSIGEYAFYNCSDLTSIDNENSITSIGDYAFFGCSSLTSIDIGNAVTSIGNSTFSVCSGLTSIDIPDSVTSIGNDAFHSCSGLTSVIIGNSVTLIGDGAFGNCKSLTEFSVGNGNKNYTTIDGVLYSTGYTKLISYPSGKQGEFKIPNSVTSIGGSAFSGCDGLTSVIIPNSVTSVGEYAFYNCNGLRKSAYPSSVSDPFSNGVRIAYPSKGSFIDESGFIWGENKKGLYFVPLNFEGDCSLPTSVTSIGGSAFSGCSGLTSVTLPTSVTSIGGSAFSGCSGLTSVTLPTSVTSIGGSAFSVCSGLTSVTIPNSVTTIGDYAFIGCNNLHTLILGSGLTYLGKWSWNFSDHKPEKVIWLANTPPENYEDWAGKVNYVANRNYDLYTRYVYDHLSSLFEVDGVIYVPVNPSERTCDVIDAKYSESVKDLNLNSTVSYRGVEMTVNHIRPYAFYGNMFIENISIQTNGEIGYNAFERCSNIAAVEIPSTVTSVGSSAFLNCNKLASAIILNSGYIADYAFSECRSLEEICVRNVGRVGKYAFENCKAANSLTIAPTVTSISDYAFSGCSKIADVTIEDADEALSLGSNGSNPLFADCPLDEVYIGRKLSYQTSSNYGYSPFYRNTSLRSVEISDVETRIYDNEFYGCTNLQEVRIGDGVKSFGKYAFSGCSKIESFEFGRAVESIGEEAFSDCTAMVSMVSHNPVPPTCGNEALDDINKWECTLHVPADALYAYKAASHWKNFFFINDDVTDSAYFEYEGLCYRVLDGSHRMCEVVAQEEAPESVRMRVAGVQATNVMIPETVSRIGLRYTVKGIADNAFSSYSALEEVTIPATVEYVGNAAFAGCSQLISVEVKAEVPPTAYSNSFDSVVYANATLTVPGESEALYKVADCWKEFARVETGVDSVLDDSVTETGRYSLDGRPVDANYRGIVVVRYSDGTTRKLNVTHATGL